VPKLARQLYLGNLSYSATPDQIREACENCGVAIARWNHAIRIVTDDAGRSKGFVFLDISPDEQLSMDGIVELIDGVLINRRPVRACEARPRPTQKTVQKPHGLQDEFDAVWEDE
jgi:hypothetical protein